MSRLNRIEGLVKMGGFKAVLAKLSDTLTGSNYTNGYLYTLQKTTDPKEYRNLLENYYMYRTGEKLNLDHPKTFNEKIQWLKLYDSLGNKTRLADKYLVREWVRDKIGEEYLVPLLGAWDSFDDIDFNALPNQFALKCNHGSGMNLVVKDKGKMGIVQAKAQFDVWMKTNFAFVNGLELQYRDIPRKIIAEKYIEQFDLGLTDYKIHIFHGVPKIIQVIGNRDLQKHTAKECFLTVDWKAEELMYHTYDMYEEIPPKPEKLEEMLEIARKLGEGFKYVRVDLYDLDGSIKFGEMTFTPASGFGRWRNNQFTVGSWIIIDDNEVRR